MRTHHSTEWNSLYSNQQPSDHRGNSATSWTSKLMKPCKSNKKKVRNKGVLFHIWLNSIGSDQSLKLTSFFIRSLTRVVTSFQTRSDKRRPSRTHLPGLPPHHIGLDPSPFPAVKKNLLFIRQWVSRVDSLRWTLIHDKVKYTLPSQAGTYWWRGPRVREVRKWVPFIMICQKIQIMIFRMSTTCPPRVRELPPIGLRFFIINKKRMAKTAPRIIF